MKRSITRWENSDPDKMADQSRAAIFFAFQDAKADILELEEKTERMKSVLRRIGWPNRGSADDLAGIGEFAAEIQATWAIEDLEANVRVSAPARKEGI